MKNLLQRVILKFFFQTSPHLSYDKLPLPLSNGRGKINKRKSPATASAGLDLLRGRSQVGKHLRVIWITKIITKAPARLPKLQTPTNVFACSLNFLLHETKRNATIGTQRKVMYIVGIPGNTFRKARKKRMSGITTTIIIQYF